MSKEQHKKFEWDENKNQSNTEKHGISFQQATKIFDDPKRTDKADERSDYGEERRITTGNIFKIMATVVYTLRNAVTRIISARPASRKEKKEYHENKREK